VIEISLDGESERTQLDITRDGKTEKLPLYVGDDVCFATQTPPPHCVVGGVALTVLCVLCVRVFVV